MHWPYTAFSDNMNRYFPLEILNIPGLLTITGPLLCVVWHAVVIKFALSFFFEFLLFGHV